MRRVFLYIYSTANIVGCVLASLGLLAFFAGVIKSFWLFIVLGLYALGYLLTPKPHTISLINSSESLDQDLSPKLEALVKKIGKRLPPNLLSQVHSIKAKLLLILPKLAAMETGAYDLHVIRQTVVDYLPQMLTAYLQLPPAFAKLHKMRNGKTAQETLSEQLDLLDAQLERIAISITSQDAEALIAQGEFLKAKFARQDDWL
jgi:hypothetical protein